MTDTLRDAWVIARKDLSIEFRTRSAFFSAVVFALLGLVIFYFAWDPTAVSVTDLAPGVLWVIFTFSGLLGLHRSFGVEIADHAIDGLLASPVSRESIFLGKAIANLIFVIAVQLIAIPALVLFYNLPLGDVLAPLIAIAVLAAIGLVAVGTLFSAMAVNTRLAELLLPMLSLPFFVPIVIAASQSTAKLLSGRPAAEGGAWIKLLLAFDIVFVALCTLAYPFTVDD
ncbi:MAG TPA: heme exporter protein CcmB [Gemmatimonadaceae bacterium]|jgi:heme exporter protein B|nr:heme exporter protein CcmB [Gemmatimonadaceae bacterium]